MDFVSIPHALESQAEALHAFALESFAPSYELYGRYPHGVESLKWHREQIDGDYCHAIMHGDELVGGIYLEPQPNHGMKISFFFIGPDHQGKRIGSNVMQLIEQHYPEVRTWTLFCAYKDYENHRFYEKRGYQRIAKATPFEGSDFTLYLYKKQM